MKRSIALGLILSALSLALHFAPVWVTMLNRGAQTWDGRALDRDYIEAMVEEHRSGPDYSFRRRPLTTWCVDALHVAGVPPRTAFISLGMALFFVTGLLVFRAALARGSSWREALLAQGIFHLSPTVLFAWFDPMYTYDEPIQYAAMIIALLAAHRGNVLTCIAAFTVATVAHETSLLFVPAVYMLMRGRERQALFAIGATCALFIAFLALYLPHAGIAQASATDALGRLSTITFNFRSLAMTGETLSYLAMTLLVPVFLLVRFNRSDAASASDRTWLRGFWITLVLNTLLVLIAAKAREARVLALPLLITWPLLGKVVGSEVARHGGWRPLITFITAGRTALILLVLTAATYLIVRVVFVISTGTQGDNLYHEYLTASIVFVSACLLADARRRRSHLGAP